jgi:hypothetical protein
MKKLTLWFAIAALLFALHPTQLKAKSKIDRTSMESSLTAMEMISSVETSEALLAIPEAEMAMGNSDKAIEDVYNNALETRLYEIKEMDMSDMTLAERRELRNEVRAIEKQQKGSGVYISVGAAILIVLLLILLL